MDCCYLEGPEERISFTEFDFDFSRTLSPCSEEAWY